MSQPHELGAREAADLIRRRELSPVELTEALLERSQRLDAVVGAFVTRTPELALEQARAAERAVLAAADPADLPPLLGVPVPVKDLTDVAGVPCTLGSATCSDVVPAEDAGVVRLLRAAGAVITGKTNTPELGLPCYTEPDVAPPARTPWDLRRSAGGSSGGAAAAVAAGLAPAAHGSDGGGSIRIPASACGLVGLKPSRGRVSPGPQGVDVVGLGVDGALTRDVRDTALLLDVLAHPWPGDLHLLPPPRTSFLEACDRDPGRLRVGLLLDPVIVAEAPVDPDCARAAREVAARLADLGHDVVEAPVPYPAERFASFEAAWGVLALLAPVPAEREALLRPLTRWLRERGRSVTGLAYATAAAGMQQAAREAAAAWAGLDVVVSPTLAQLPALVGALRDDADPAADFAAQSRFSPWTSVWNTTGRPAVSLPTHRVERDGAVLPVGVMLGGPPQGEELVLSVAAQVEQAMPWAGTLPVEPVPDRR